VFESSKFNIKESDFHLAELGCGFNRDTMISPIFGAMLITTVLNSGTSLVPGIVNQVKTSHGEIIYKSRKEPYKTAMTPKTAETMTQIMQKTITNGTAKKSFRGSSKDKTLSKLVIGGKTGSLYNRKRTVKYDWFTGFGKEKTGNRALAISIVVGHRKYIGTRASAYGKMVLKNYFKDKPMTTTTAKLK
jgi:peptidoglycan glycosyltransferase